MVLGVFFVAVVRNIIICSQPNYLGQLALILGGVASLFKPPFCPGSDARV